MLECAGWNGAFAGRLLADGGADVVRVVPPAGDSFDAEPPFFGTTPVSIQGAWYNAGKRLLPLDLASGAGRGRLIGLAGEADILIEDWRPGRAPLTDAEAAAANPRLTRVSVTAMGREGPWSGLAVNDLVANALCGSASVTGDADAPPLSGYGNQSVHTAGLYASICALAAHRASVANGHGVHVDLSAHEALVSCTEQMLMQWFFPTGFSWKSAVAPRQGNVHWTGAYAVYTGHSGGGLMVTPALRFADVLLPWLSADGAAQDLTDPTKYADLLALLGDIPHVMQVLKDWVGTKDARELFFEAQRRHQPFGLVQSIPEAAASPQAAARAYFKPVPVSGFGETPFPGRFFRTDADAGHPAPPTRVPLLDLGWAERPATAPAAQRVPTALPLTGVRVLDFTHVLAGPFGTRVLGDLGADVLKVGTTARGAAVNSTLHPYYVCWNRNKRSIFVNMASAGGRDVARALAAQSDVVIENFSAGVLARWGLDRTSMAAVNPRLTVITMGGMGRSGPWKDFVTYAPTIHALSGITYMTGTPGRHDIGYGFSLTDHLSGLVGAVAALQGIEHARRTGEGLDIDLSQYEAGLGLMAPALIDHLANGATPEPVGNRHPWAAWAPHGVYRCSGDDRWVAIAARGDGQWHALCGVMGRLGLVADHRFATHEGRVANQDALDATVEEWTVTLDRYDAMAACQAAGIAAGAMQDAADLTGRDPQLAARRYFDTATTVPWGEHGIDRFPALFDGARPPRYEAAREGGADTSAVLSEVLGLSGEAIADLAARDALS